MATSKVHTSTLRAPQETGDPMSTSPPIGLDIAALQERCHTRREARPSARRYSLNCLLMSTLRGRKQIQSWLHVAQNGTEMVQKLYKDRIKVSRISAPGVLIFLSPPLVEGRGV
eukprot:1107843-Prorocentrum_minimum.AAC.3